jgi:pSer/pThr/pTyr-binding forkhead associated (FHA) protein
MEAKLISLDYRVPQCDTRLNGSPVVIGHAADAGIQLDDLSVSEHHCQIEAEGDHFLVRDLGSVHGTYVNGARVSQSPLRPGDELSVGMMTFLLRA